MQVRAETFLNGTLSPVAAELIERSRILGLRALTLVDGIRVGDQASPRRGFSVEFAQHREYVPGDDLRHLDWRAYARSERLIIKEYRQETNFTAHMVTDMTGSMSYSGSSLAKSSMAKLLGLVTARVASSQGDATALWLASGANPSQDPCIVPAGSRAGSLLSLLTRLGSLDADPPTETAHSKSALGLALGSLASRSLRRGMVVVFSDLLEDWDGLIGPMRQIRAKGHDLIVVHIVHSDELELPFKGEVRFDDLESPIKVLARPHQLRDRYRKEIATWRNRIEGDLTAIRADYTLVRADLDPSESWLDLMAHRMVRRKTSGGA